MAIKKSSPAGIPQKLLGLLDVAEETLQKAIIVTFGADVLDVYQRLLRINDPYSIYKVLSNLEEKDLRHIARCNSISLELIHACETAFRVTQLRRKVGKASLPKKLPYALTYVFTAHPTEARSPELLHLINEIRSSLVNELDIQSNRLEINLLPLLSLALRLPLARNEKPRVEDEALHIYDHILSEDIIQQQLRFREQGLTVHFRTWVGGDKDGHPGVTAATMTMSLNISRSTLHGFIQKELKLFCENFAHMQKEDSVLESLLDRFSVALRTLSRLTDGDGKKIKDLHEILDQLVSHLRVSFGGTPSHLRNIENLMWLYPAMVVPLELREDASLFEQKSEISNMLSQLAKLSSGFEAKWYVRGLVVSMVESSKDLNRAYELMQSHLSASPIPIVPLFETEQSLKQAVPILKEHFKTPRLLDSHRQLWSGRYEVMLGYSDSSKEIGVFASRSLIVATMHKLDQLFRHERLSPVFFQGSGGSIERGGGSIEQQVQGWPRSALEIYKLTVQGEMVSRNFSYPELMSAQVKKLLEQYNKPLVKTVKIQSETAQFIESTKENYKVLRADKDFLQLLSHATPYTLLQELKMGSRPSARAQTHGDPQSLKIRAIPWVLCWTQIRLLLPTWWGLGKAWQDVRTSSQKRKIVKDFNTSPQLISLIKLLGFTLDKTHFKVFEFYLKQSDLSSDLKRKWHALILTEFQLARKFYLEVSAGKDHWDQRPRLSQSIRLRRDQTTVLNITQKLAWERKDMALFRETVTGIASGMMNTG
jgi:phosphoenolpyruvate carboxylase